MVKLFSTVAVGALMFGAQTLNATALERWLNIHNSSSYEICYVYITHVDDPDWGPDLFGPCIPPGYYQTVDPGWQQGYCKMDMKFVFDDGVEVIESNYNICEGTDFYLYD